MSNGENNPLFGRYEKLVLLVLGFLLTTIAGGILGSHLQTYRAKKERQEQLFMEVSELMDTRALVMRRVLAAHREQMPPEEVTARWNAYRNLLERWNTRLNRNLALMQRYFGMHGRTCFNNAHQEFRRIGERLEAVRDTSLLATDTAAIRRDLDKLNRDFYQFNLILLNSLDAWTIIGRDPMVCSVPSPSRGRDGAKREPASFRERLHADAGLSILAAK